MTASKRCTKIPASALLGRLAGTFCFFQMQPRTPSIPIDEPAAKELFERRYGRELSAEEQREITANLTGFFSVIREWDRASSGGVTLKPDHSELLGGDQ